MVGNVLVESHTPCTLKTSFVDKTGVAHKFILMASTLVASSSHTISLF
jgi:hypothetical protein